MFSLQINNPNTSSVYLNSKLDPSNFEQFCLNLKTLIQTALDAEDLNDPQYKCIIDFAETHIVYPNLRTMIGHLAATLKFQYPSLSTEEVNALKNMLEEFKRNMTATPHRAFFDSNSAPSAAPAPAAQSPAPTFRP